MSNRSIVDRVLLCAAALCAAGLAWQLTVLVTSKNHAASFRKIETVSPASAQALNEVPGTPPPTTVRVVYPDGISAKTVGKATDAADGTPISTPNLAPSKRSPPNSVVSTSPLALPSADPVAVVTPVVARDNIPSVAPVTAAVSAASSTIAAAVVDVTAPEPATAPSPPAETQSPRGAVNINSASIDDLNHLNGAGRIGEAIARHRPYHSVEDLLKKRVVRRGVYDQIKDQLAAE